MRLFDLLVAKKLAGGETPTTDYQVAVKYADTTVKSFQYITELVVSEGVTVIDELVFKGSKLSKLILSNTVTRINDYAFHNCMNLHNIKLPSSISYLGQFAFGEHDGLTIDLTDFDATNIPFCWGNAFNSSQEHYEDLHFIFATQAALDAFAADSGWSAYSQYFEVVS